MERTCIEKISEYIGKPVVIAGFAQTIRDQGSIAFILVRDRTGTVQAVVPKHRTEALAAAKALGHESVVQIRGTAKREAQAPGGIEVEAEEISVLSHADPELPIPIMEKGSQSEADQSLRMDWRWIDLRKPKNTLVFRAWTAMEAAFREYWVSSGYVEIHSPKLISAASESGAEVFEVKYFDRKAYLAQSPQFYKQMAMAAGLEKVFEVGPVFRAEPSFTSRHATEFTGYDSEISYISSHEDVIRELERIIPFVLGKVKDALGEEIRDMFGREVPVPSVPFPRISMAEAKKILGDMGVPSEKEGDLSPEEERRICEHAKESLGSEFVFITGYPVSVRPFYHMREQQNPALTKSFDLLWNGIEVVTGAQREHRYDVLVAQAEEKGMRIESLQFYLDFFKYGCPPHGGFGMGANRMLMKLLGLESIREASFVYRSVKRLTP